MPAKPLFGPALPSRSFRRILCFSGSNWPTLGVVPAPISFPLNFGKAAEHPVINPETGIREIKGDLHEADSSFFNPVRLLRATPKSFQRGRLRITYPTFCRNSGSTIGLGQC